MREHQSCALVRVAVGLVVGAAGPSGCVGTGHDSGTGTEITIKTFSNGFLPPSGATRNADLVAIHDGDGDGEWAVVTGNGGVYHAMIAGPRYAVAIGCREGDTNLQLYYQAISDATELHDEGCLSRDRVHVAVTLTGTDSKQSASVSVGSVTANGMGNTPVDLEVPKGTVDVLAVAVVSSVLLVYRGPTLDLQTDQSLQFDMATLGGPLEAHPLTLGGLEPGESVGITSSYTTTNGRVLNLAGNDFASGDASYATINAAQRAPTDFSTIFAQGFRLGSTAYYRQVATSFVTPEPLTLELPPDWSAVPPTVLEGAVPRAIVTLPVTPSHLGTVEYMTWVNTVNPPRTVAAVVKQGWIGDQSSVTITTPDLSKLPGWLPEMGLAPNMPVSWTNARRDCKIPYETPFLDGQVIFANYSLGETDPTSMAR